MNLLKTNWNLETENPISNENTRHKEHLGVNNSFPEHGNEIEEIISKRLPPIIRWGTVYFFFLLLLIAIISWFIKYPDIIQTSAKLTSINAPKPVLANISGKLIKLTIQENEEVKQNQILGYLESTADQEEVLRLSSYIDTIQNLLDTNHPESIQVYLKISYPQLGELQLPYQTFSQAFLSFKNYLSNGFYLHKKNMLETDLSNLMRLHINLLKQKELIDQDLALSQKSFNANQLLRDNKVISESDYFDEKSKFINKKLSLPQMINTIINNEALQNEKQEEIAELENTIREQKVIFQQALSTFKSQMDEWKKKYLLIAPIAGKVAFATFIQENQQLQINQTICFINPQNSQYYAQIIIPQSNFGKVLMGQEVLLKFPSYPFEEFGVIKGKIEFISHIATDSGYYAKVELINGLKTNYNRQIQYRDGLEAQAEIITRNMRLLEKFYFNIAKQVKKQ
jgi:HlyD family secretion protein